MEWIMRKISPGKRLVIGKNNAVVLRVAFMASFHRPLRSFLLLWRESSDVVGKHMKIGTVVNDPTCQLLCTTSTQHHSSTVEPTVMEKPRKMWIGTLLREIGSINVNQV